MPSYIVLDSGPLSNSAVPLAKEGETPTESQLCRAWLARCQRAGVTLIVPAIAYYETLREVELRRADKKRERLTRFVFGTSVQLISLSTEQLEIAASLWGEVRRSGKPTASDAALDADLIFVAQVRALGLPDSDYVVATTNVGHIGRFLRCDEWMNIEP